MRAIIKPTLFILMSFLFFSFPVYAKEQPDAMLQRVTRDLIAELRREDKTLASQPNYIYKIIHKTLVPHVDWGIMAQWVVGREAWIKATPSQRKQFANEFRDLLIRTYASTLRAYNNQVIEYQPVRGGVAGKSRVQIASLIKETGREPIKVSYRLIDKKNGWKVYDISIEGVSLLKGFQAQFAPDIRQHGMDYLIRKLRQHNEKPLR